MTAIAFVPAFQKEGDGYTVFAGGAAAWSKLHGDAPIYEFAAHKMNGTEPIKEKVAETQARRAQILNILAQQKAPLTHAIFACHGWRTGLQAGFDTLSADMLAKALARIASIDLRVTLYSCTCGGGPLDRKWTADLNETGDRGFGDELRDRLCINGITSCTVDAHATAGHAFRNSYVRRFSGSGRMAASVGGAWVISPGSNLWTQWRMGLVNTSLKYRYTDMAPQEIAAEIVKLR